MPSPGMGSARSIADRQFRATHRTAVPDDTPCVTWRWRSSLNWTCSSCRSVDCRNSWTAWSNHTTAFSTSRL